MPWERLIDQGRKCFSDPQFDQRERDYKLRIAEALRDVLELARDGDDWQSALKAVFTRTSYQYNLSDWRQHNWLLKIEDEGAEAVRASLTRFLSDTKSALDRFADFAQVAERFAGDQGANPGSILAVGSVFNFAVAPAQLPIIKTSVFAFAEDEADLPRPKGTVTEIYETHLEFAAVAREKFEAAGLPIRDMLDVQSVIFETFRAVQSATSNPLQSFFKRAFNEYEDARQNGEFGREHPIWQAFEDATALVNATETIAGNETLEARFSVGQGNWAKVPWIALLDGRETKSTQHGVYPVYLFRQDGSGAYLALAQGVTEPKRELGVTGAYEVLSRRAEDLREQCGELAESGFELNGEIDLRSDPGLGRDYEVSVAAHKLYEAGSVPTDAQLREDLGAMVNAYSRYLDDRSSDDLAELVERWRAETSYPSEEDEEQDERRRDLAARLSEELLRSVEAEPDRFDELGFGKFAHKYYYGGPGSMAVVNEAVKGSSENRSRVARALRHLIYGSGSPAGRIDDVVGEEDFKVPGFGETLAVKALAVTDPDRWLPIYPFTGDMGKRALMASRELGLADPAELDDLSVGERAERANDLLRAVVEQLVPKDPWGQTRFLYWLRERQLGETDLSTSSLAQLAESLYLELDWLEEAVSLLREKGQVIFKGPPGTGKTYVARKLADHLAGDPSRVRLVQFHASYAYEDFVQGYRPTLTDDGQPAFKLVSGPLVDLAQRAAADREHTYILLIDELNRGNVAKVFGELYFLLEYRGENVRLQYGSGSSDPDFSLPSNLFFIGTMNTADQSIALLDSALRRRFFFIDFYPTEPPISRLLRRWLERNGYANFLWLADVVDEVNRRLGDREIALGPSYFLDPDRALTDERIGRLWRHAVLPYLEEQFFGQEEQRVDYELATLREAVAKPAVEASQPPAVEGSGATGQLGTPDDAVDD